MLPLPDEPTLRSVRPRLGGLVAWGLLVGVAEAASVAALFLLGMALATGSLPEGVLGALGHTASQALGADLLVTLALGLLGAALLRAAVSLEYERRLARLHADVARQLFERLLPGYFSMEPSRFLSRNSSDRAVHLTHDIDRGALAFVSWVRASSLALVLLLLAGLLVAVDWRASVLGGLAATGLAMAVLPLTRWTGSTAVRRRPAHAELAVSVSEPLRAYRDLAASGLWPRFHRRAAADLDRFLALSKRLTLLQASTPHVLEVGVALVLVVGIAAAAAFGPGTGAATPMLILLLAGTYRFLPTLQRLLHNLNTHRLHRPSLDAVVAELQMVRAHPHAAARPGEPLDGDLFRLHGVCFQHRDGEPILAGVDLRLRPRQRLGIVGPSGAGKTTLVDLLLGLLTPTAGDLRRGLGPGGRTLRIAYLPQQPAFVQATVLDNLAVVDGERVDAAEARRLLHLVGLDLPLGLALGEGGRGLSGGQRQRLGLARALHGDPDVLVLDEPTANLDGAAELEVVQALDRLEGLAMVVVTHRKAPLALCDRVWRLEEGRLVPEAGPGAQDVHETAARQARPRRPRAVLPSEAAP